METWRLREVGLTVGGRGGPAARLGTRRPNSGPCMHIHALKLLRPQLRSNLVALPRRANIHCCQSVSSDDASCLRQGPSSFRRACGRIITVLLPRPHGLWSDLGASPCSSSDVEMPRRIGQRPSDARIREETIMFLNRAKLPSDGQVSRPVYGDPSQVARKQDQRNP